MRKELEIHASPFYFAYCPKHKNKLPELKNGWFDVAFWCEECQSAYYIGLRKLKNVDIDEVRKQLNQQEDNRKVEE